MIAATEFKHALERIVGTHMADSQIRQLLRSIDTDGDGVIEYPEFVAKFGLEKTSTSGTPGALNNSESETKGDDPESWMVEFVTGMGAAMQRSKRPLKDLFRKFDSNNDGMIDYAEFYKTLHDMQCPLSEDEMKKVALFMDDDKDGFIDVDEFASGFRISHGTTGGSNEGNGNDDPHHWESRVKHQLLRMFYHNKASLMHVFHSYDDTHDGLITKDIFIKSMNALLSVQDDVQISDESIIHLSETLTNTDGMIDYTSFVDSFSMNKGTTSS